MNWKNYFTSIILKRGKEYFDSGKVAELVIDSKRIHTIVFGTKNYAVEISLNRNGEPRKFRCDCRHFYEGHNCKHIAAALFAYYSNHEEKSLPELLSHNNLSMSAVRQMFSELKREYSDRYGFVDYYNARYFADAIANLLEKIPASTNDTLLSFDIVNYIIINFVKIPMDDDGGACMVCETAEEAWHDIYQKSNMAIRRKMFHWFEKIIVEPDGELWMLEDNVLHFFDKHFSEPELSGRKLEIINEQINLSKSKSPEKLFESEFKIAAWIKIKTQHLITTNASRDEIEKTFLLNWDNHITRTDYIDWLISDKRYKDALSAIKKSIRLNNNDDMSNYYNYDRLRIIYQKLGNVEKQIESLIWLIKNHDPEKYIAELKQLVSRAEWKKRRLEIISSISRPYIRTYLLAKERMTPELYAEVIATEDPDDFYRYAARIAKINPDKVIRRYVEFLDIEAKIANNRDQYKQLTQKLRKLAKLPNGAAAAQKVLEMWKEQYPKRRAMMEELERLKFA